MNPSCEIEESCKETSKDEFNFILSGRYRERKEHPSRKKHHEHVCTHNEYLGTKSTTAQTGCNTGLRGVSLEI